MKHNQYNQDITTNRGEGVLVAAPWSGSGKTMISCGLMQVFCDMGRKVRGFKCGPDYIDPMFHRQVLGVSSRNLDTFFSDAKQIRELYERDMADGQLSIVEGVMGLYDGLGGIREEGSAYHLAQTLDLPVLLVMDAHGMGRTVLALLRGIIEQDKDHRIIGVILNRTSASYGAVIAPLIERELELAVFGTLPSLPDIHIESRHLGLKRPEEICGLKEQLRLVAGQIRQNIDIEALDQLLRGWERMTAGTEDTSHQGETACDNEPEAGRIRRSAGDGGRRGETASVKIAVARDEAFCFYYEDNLRLLEENGAEIVYFSPLHDCRLPKNIQGLLLGGGYPELYARELSENAAMREAVRSVLGGGMPSVAECGGFLYLHRNLEGADKEMYPMVGAIPQDACNTGKLVRFGYLTLREKKSCFLAPGTQIKAHEFHYYDSGDNGQGCVGTKPVSHKSWDCIHVESDHWWGFPHLYYPSNEGFARQFVQKCREYHG